MTQSIRKQRFIDYLDNNMFSHAYLFEVGNYDKDYKFILEFVKLLFCKDKKFNELNCNDCNICSLIDEEKFLDLYIVRAEGNEIKKEQLINLESEFSNTSIVSDKKVYIILEADKMNNYASNSILKFLEEPNENIIGILVTKNKYRILPTIISRCLYFNIREDQNYNFDDDYYLEFVKKLVNPDDLFICYEEINNYFYDLEDKDENDEDKKSRRVYNKKKIFNFFNNLNIYILDYYNGNVSNEDLDKIDKDKLLNYINIIQDSLFDLEYNLNYKLWFDSLFSKLIGGNYD